MATDMLKLQNGSDIRGVAIGDKTNLTDEAVTRIGAALAVLLQKRLGTNNLRIAIGHDSRLSANKMLNSLAYGVCSAGAQAFSTGLSSTPAMFMSTVMEKHRYDAAVMITASHLPYDRNGFKFFTAKGGFEKSDISELLRLAQELAMPEHAAFKLESAEIMQDYSAFLREKIIEKASKGNLPLEGLHIVVDAGNGAGGFFAKNVLLPLGADITGSIFQEPDGNFPNHEPNPENSAAMEAISRATQSAGADLGLIFDTDVDRFACVLKDGTVINRNRLIALMSTIMLREHKNACIVTDSVTSDGLASFITERGGTHKRFKRGYRNVINEAKRLCDTGLDACLAIETSGHGALRENYFLDDGAYMAAIIVAALANEPVEKLISGLTEPAEATEIRLSILSEDFAAYGSKVIKALELKVAETEGLTPASENFEGLRVNCDKAHGDGWFLLRMSLHDPVLPLNLESNSNGGIELMRAWLKGFFAEFNELSGF